MGSGKDTSVGVLFVCTGNICRSPTAEAVFRHKVREAGLSHAFHIDSAGTHGYHIGDQPDSRSIATALAKGVDMRDLKARKLAPEDFDRFDYVLAMDSSHFKLLSRYGSARLAMFLGEGDVPDPYYGTQKDFDLVYELVDRQCGVLLNELLKKHGSQL